MMVKADGAQYILAMYTATSCCTVALTSGKRQGGRVLAELSLSGKITHSRRLLLNIDRLLKDTGLAWQQISAIAIGLGPGSFTGLRIGMATAKGLAAAAAKPLVGVSTLDMLAAQCSSPLLIGSVLDARKKEVYAAFYRCGAEGLTCRITEPVVIAPTVLAREIREEVLLVGDGVVLYHDIFAEALGARLSVAPSPLHEPSAAVLGLLAGEKLLQGATLDVDAASPLYVRASDAELNLGNQGKEAPLAL